MHTSRQVICPKCGHADAVRKVSAIVAEQTRSGEASGIGIGFGDSSPEFMAFATTVTSRSDLASRLAPPRKPAQPRGYGRAAVFGFTRLILVFVVGFALIGAILISFPLLMSTYSRNPLLLLVPIMIGISFLIAATVWLARSSIRDVHARSHEREIYEARFQAWKGAITQWNDSYYCARDDAVFTSKTSQRVPEIASSPFPELR